MIDSVSLDIPRYNSRAIVASILYLVLGVRYQEFTFAFISQNFPMPYGLNQYFSNIAGNNMFNQLFSQFLYQGFGFIFEEIFPTIQYVAAFFQIPFDYSVPSTGAQLRVRIKGIII